jgi:hypothetical protein
MFSITADMCHADTALASQMASCGRARSAAHRIARALPRQQCCTCNHGRQPKQIRRGEDVRETCASRNFRRLVRCDSYASHAAQVDNDAVTQGSTRPIVASAAHRQRKTAGACGSNGEAHVLSRPAVDDNARHAPDRFCPNGHRGSVAIIARHRHPAERLFAKTIQCSSDGVSRDAASPDPRWEASRPAPHHSAGRARRQRRPRPYCNWRERRSR